MGADWTLTALRELPDEPWWIDLYCDACGWRTHESCAGAGNAGEYAEHHGFYAHGLGVERAA